MKPKDQLIKEIERLKSMKHNRGFYPYEMCDPNSKTVTTINRSQAISAINTFLKDYRLVKKGDIERLINIQKETIQSLWDNMEEPSKSVRIGFKGLLEGDKGDIVIERDENVTGHDQTHITAICCHKRFITELKSLGGGE